MQFLGTNYQLQSLQNCNQVQSLKYKLFSDCNVSKAAGKSKNKQMTISTEMTTKSPQLNEDQSHSYPMEKVSTVKSRFYVSRFYVKSRIEVEKYDDQI